MIGIQGENGLEEVTKSPCDTSLDANSTNSVENGVVTQAINELKVKTAEITGTTDANGRIIGSSTSGSGIVVVGAWRYKSSNLVVPYRYIDNDVPTNVIGFKVTSSETGSVVANTTMTIKYAYLDTTLI